MIEYTRTSFEPGCWACFWKSPGERIIKVPNVGSGSLVDVLTIKGRALKGFVFNSAEHYAEQSIKRPARKHRHPVLNPARFSTWAIDGIFVGDMNSPMEHGVPVKAYLIAEKEILSLHGAEMEELFGRVWTPFSPHTYIPQP